MYTYVHVLYVVVALCYVSLGLRDITVYLFLELQKAKETMLKEKQKQLRDKMVADSLKEWQKILPNWENM